MKGKKIFISKGIYIFLLLGLLTGFLSPESVISSPLDDVDDPRIINLTISLYKDSVSDTEKVQYETILNYFADAIYEASNTAHKIGTVTIFTGSRNSRTADIVWTDECHPSARIGGVLISDGHVNMCDRFVSSSSGFVYDFLSSSNNIEAGGYTVGHEWGHYYYSLYDEYALKPNDKPVDRSIMNSQWSAANQNYAWLNFSTKANFNEENAQYRKYGMSAWELFGQEPLIDMILEKDDLAIPLRLRFLELEAVAPYIDEEARIDLPSSGTSTESRSELKVIWADQVNLEIVLDQSSSMDGEKIANVIEAAKLMVDLTETGFSSIGVISFNDQVYEVQSLTSITSEQDKKDIKQKIDNIDSSGNTAIGDAAQQALKVLTLTTQDNNPGVVFLLSDGQNNRGIDPTSILSDYKNANIPIYTFAYGSDADVALLQQMASETGGKFYNPESSLDNILQAFQDANQWVTPGRFDTLLESFSMSAGQVLNYPVVFDSEISTADIVLYYSGSPSDLEVNLLDPNNNVNSAINCTGIGDATLCQGTANINESGNWNLKLEAQNDIRPLTFRISGLMKTGQVPVTASVSSISGEVVHYPDPIVLTASVSAEAPLTGVNLIAAVESPDGSVQEFQMADDGVAPDVLADDGFYSAILDYEINGPHSITVQFDNESGTAEMTYLGYAPSLGPNGEYIPMPDPIPMTENFQRMSRIEIQVADVMADDHANLPEGATLLPLDNSGIPGKIDYEGDLDVFRIQSDSAGTYLLRVSSLALGMDPKIRLLGEDGVQVLEEKDLSMMSNQDQYLYLKLEMDEQEVVFAEISQNGSSYRGTYLVSAGLKLPAEEIVTPTPSGSGGVSGGSSGLFIVIIAVAGAAVLLAVLSQSKKKQGFNKLSKTPVLQVFTEGGIGPSFNITKKQYLIGRGSSCDLKLHDNSVSRSHALIIFEKGVWRIIDQQSQTGVVVNGKRITSAILEPGDYIQIGSTRFRFIA